MWKYCIRETALDPVRLLWDSPNLKINSLIIIITSPTIALSPSSTKRINIEALNTSSTPYMHKTGSQMLGERKDPQHTLFCRENEYCCDLRAFLNAFIELSTNPVFGELLEGFQQNSACFSSIVKSNVFVAKICKDAFAVVAESHPCHPEQT